MKKSVVLIVAIVVFAPFGQTTASSSTTFDDSAGAYRGATRMDNANVVDDPAGPPPAPAPALDGILLRVFELTNAERASRGLAPLRHNGLLSQAADAHSKDQAAQEKLTHTGSDGSSPGDRIDRTGYPWRTWAENAAGGYGTAERVVDGWVRSPGHLANILNPNVTEIGLGIAYTAGGYPYWTQVFAAPR